MVKDHSDSERRNPMLPHGLLFPISSKGSFICIIPYRITHTTVFVTPVAGHWLEREIAQWVHRSDDPSHHERTLLPRSYISLHRETGFASLSERRQYHLLHYKLWMMYQLCRGMKPAYLSAKLSQTVAEYSRHPLRDSDHLQCFKNHSKLFSNLFSLRSKIME